MRGFWEDLAFTVVIGFFEVGSVVGVLAFVFGIPLMYWWGMR